MNGRARRAVGALVLAIPLSSAVGTASAARDPGGAAGAARNPPVAAAQTGDSFAVASIKQNTSGLPYNQSTERADGLALVNESLRDIIALAYDVHDFQLSGLPNWAADERFDIAARAGRALSPEEKRTRLRQLLLDRFRLRVRTDMREQPTYALTVAGEPPGSGLKPRDCAVPGIGGLPCGSGIASADGGILRLGGVPVARLAAFVGSVLGRVVRDETGLTGVFDMDLQWRPDIGLSPDLSDEAKTRIESRPALPVALREQLGLGLQARRAPVTIVIVESVSRPAPD